jgi:acyl-CoA thioester hydrolase
MARVKIIFPDKKSLLTVQIPVRITDLNYGNHVGNDKILSLVHEARVQLLSHLGNYQEMDIGGCGLIMADALIAFRGEGFYGDLLQIELFADDISTFSFDIFYRIRAQRQDKDILIAEVKTGMVCFDYKQHKPTPLPETFRKKILA